MWPRLNTTVKYSVLFHWIRRENSCFESECWSVLAEVESRYFINVKHRDMCNPPPGSAPFTPSGSRTWDAGPGGGRSTKEAKGYSLQRQPLERLFLRSGEWGLHTALLAYIRYTHRPKPHSHPGHGTNVTPPGPHHHTERVSNLGCWHGRRALYQGG